MINTYQSLQYMKLVITIDINGNPLECLFQGGKTYPYRENGTFRTIDDKVIAEIEKHEQFNKQFVLIKSVESQDEIVIEKTEDNTTKELESTDVLPENNSNVQDGENNDELVTDPNPPASGDGTIIVADIKNSQQAKLYLNKNFNVPFSRLSNIEAVVKETKIANLSFPNWIIK